jgi:dsDNA-specific endonuclease/ATPase MutS2
MKFKVGQSIEFLDEKMTGKVLEVRSNGTYKVETEDGFEREVSEREIIAHGNEVYDLTPLIDPEERSKIIVEKEVDADKVSNRSKKHVIQGEFIEREIDLHIEAILDYHRHLSNAEIVLIQTNHLRRELDRAEYDGLRRIVVIHGRGTGALKSEVIDILEQRGNLRFYDAEYKIYGLGATEVLFT